MVAVNQVTGTSKEDDTPMFRLHIRLKHCQGLCPNWLTPYYIRNVCLCVANGRICLGAIPQVAGNIQYIQSACYLFRQIGEVYDPPLTHFGKSQLRPSLYQLTALWIRKENPSPNVSPVICSQGCCFWNENRLWILTKHATMWLHLALDFQQFKTFLKDDILYIPKYGQVLFRFRMTKIFAMIQRWSLQIRTQIVIYMNALLLNIDLWLQILKRYILIFIRSSRII